MNPFHARLRTRTLVLALTTSVAACGIPQAIQMAQLGQTGIMPGMPAPEPEDYTTARHGAWSGLPERIEFTPARVGSGAEFTDWVRNELDVVVTFDRVLGEGDGATRRERYRQLHDGVPVFGTTYTARTRGSSVATVSGLVYDGIEVPTDARVSAADATASAQDRFRDRVPVGAAELFVLPDHFEREARFHLAWGVEMLSPEDATRVRVWVDAREPGTILWTDPLTRLAFVPGSGVTSDGRSVTFGSQHTDAAGAPGVAPVAGDATGYRLLDPIRNLHTVTMDPAGAPRDRQWVTWEEYFPPNEIVDADDAWEASPAAVDVHWGLTVAHDYFDARHGWTGYDGAGGYLRGIVDATATHAAFSPPHALLFGSAGGTPMTSLDLVAHEYAHAVIESIVGLSHHGESGPLAEGLADIFMTQVEFSAGRGDWTFDPRTPGAPLRSLSDPASTGHPTTYQGDAWVPPSEALPWQSGTAWETHHRNSTIASHWFYLLSEGGAGENDNGEAFNVRPIGRDVAAELTFESLFELSPIADFAEMRRATIELAADRFGDCSDEVAQVTAAWAAVGVGDPYCGCFEGSFALLSGTNTVTLQFDEVDPVTLTPPEDALPIGREWEANGELLGGYRIRGDDISMEIRNEDGERTIFYSSRTGSNWGIAQATEGSAVYDAAAASAAFRSLLTTKIPLVGVPQRLLTRAQYLAYRAAIRTGRRMTRGGYLVYEYSVAGLEPTIDEDALELNVPISGPWGIYGNPADFVPWLRDVGRGVPFTSDGFISESNQGRWLATEEICLSYADIGATIARYPPGFHEISRQIFAGFPVFMDQMDRRTYPTTRVEETDWLGVVDLSEHPVDDAYFRPQGR